MSISQSIASTIARTAVKTIGGGSAQPAWAPTDTADLTHWLDASDADSISDTAGAVDSWTSLAGTNLVLSATTTQRPTTGSTTINGKNVIDFNGAANTIGSVDGLPVRSQPNTIFAVIKPSNTGAHHWITSRSGSRELIYNNAGNWAAFGELANLNGSAYAAQLTFVGCYFNNLNSVFWVNGNEYTGSTGTASLNGLRLGSNSAGSANWAAGSIAEVLVYDSDARASLADVRAYFAAKWGTPA